MPLLDDYLTQDGLAKELGKDKRTIQRWNRLRVGPARTVIGRTVLYHKDDVTAWLQAQRRQLPPRGRRS